MTIICQQPIWSITVQVPNKLSINCFNILPTNGKGGGKAFIVVTFLIFGFTYNFLRNYLSIIFFFPFFPWMWSMFSNDFYPHLLTFNDLAYKRNKSPESKNDEMCQWIYLIPHQHAAKHTRRSTAADCSSSFPKPIHQTRVLNTSGNKLPILVHRTMKTLLSLMNLFECLHQSNSHFRAMNP